MFKKFLPVIAVAVISFASSPISASAQNYGPFAPEDVYQSFGMNHEAQVGAECARQYGVSETAAGCIVSQLTEEEISKCFTDGIGGRGCFGDNNTLVIATRNMWSDIVEGPGPNNDVVKAVEALRDLFSW